MKYAHKIVQQHTVTLANGVTVTREDVAGLVHTCKVQIENAQTSIRCLDAQMRKEVETLELLQNDLVQLETLAKGS